MASIDNSLTVSCPICGASPTEKCELHSGFDRFESHRERRDIAAELALAGSPRAAKTPAASGRSGIELPRSGKITKLSTEDIRLRQEPLQQWEVEGSGELVRTFDFADFRAAVRFVNLVADAAEAAGHHPDIDIRYNKVRLSLVTHDAGGLTAKDFDLAEAADKLA